MNLLDCGTSLTTLHLVLTFLLRVFVVAVVVATFSACAFADDSSSLLHVDGQIYVTRKDRETVKMSLVTVRIVDRLAAQKIVAEAGERKERVRLAVARDRDWRERSLALATAIPRMNQADSAKARETLATLRTLVISNRPFASTDLADSKESDLLRLVQWPSAKTVETDADGVFRLDLPAGDWTAVAWAQRRVVDAEEKYLWVVPVRPGERTLLNNGNLFVDSLH